VNVYKMDQGKTFKESELYPTNIDENEYSSKSVLLGSKVFTATDYAGGRTNSYVIQIDLDTTFVFGQNKFSSELKASY
ncbi:hypothetical protein JZU68_06930, partial [bacterium]|nr:hypothetical protein [bacterium]